VFLKKIQNELEEMFLKKQIEVVRPSRIEDCPRAIVLDALVGMSEEIEEIPIDEEKKEEEWRKGAALAGLIYEQIVCPILISDGFDYQVKVETDYLSGTCDFYKYDPETGTATVIDIKTIARKSLPFIPQQKHISQVMVYMDGALNGRVYKVDPETQEIREYPRAKQVEGYLLYILRENPLYFSPRQEVKVEYDPDRIERLKKRAHELREWISKGEIPPVPEGFHPFQFPCYINMYEGAFYCPHWKTCWSTLMLQEGDEIPEELIDVATQYIEADTAYHFWKDRREDLHDQIVQLTMGHPSLTIPARGGVIKKTTYSYERIDYKAVLEGLIEFLRERIPVNYLVEITKVITDLKDRFKIRDVRVRLTAGGEPNQPK